MRGREYSFSAREGFGDRAGDLSAVAYDLTLMGLGGFGFMWPFSTNWTVTKVVKTKSVVDLGIYISC